MKVICSIGPSCNSENMLKELVMNGMTHLRYNFSHANQNEARRQIDYVRGLKPDVKVIQDLQGSKMRVSNSCRGEFRVDAGDRVLFCHESCYEACKNSHQNVTIVPVSFEGGYDRMRGAAKILMKDATMEFQVVDQLENCMVTKVIKGGMVRAQKGMNIPGLTRKGIGMTMKDRVDARWGIENGVDIIILSFVSCAQDIIDFKNYIRKIIRHEDKFKMPEIWAKIECQEGSDNFTGILRNVDGIMIGRGDLCAEIGIVQVPVVQEEILRRMKRSRKDFIIATYVLDSMRKNSCPTLSEAQCVYNLIKEGVTGFMLCGEVSTGRYPVEALKALRKMIELYEQVPPCGEICPNDV